MYSCVFLEKKKDTLRFNNNNYGAYSYLILSVGVQ